MYDSVKGHFCQRVMWFWLGGVLLTTMIFLLLSLGSAFLLVEILTVLSPLESLLLL
jgi:hypothetical protein